MSTLYAVPKPARAPRLRERRAKGLARTSELARKSRTKQRTSYGSEKGHADWPAFKARILDRDGHRCVFRCADQHLGVTVHHLKSVGSGGKNTDDNAATLCADCHDGVHAGVIARQAVRDALVALHGAGVLGQGAAA